MALFLIHFLAFHHYNEFTVEDRFNSAQLIIVEEPICLRQLQMLIPCLPTFHQMKTLMLASITCTTLGMVKLWHSWKFLNSNLPKMLYSCIFAFVFDTHHVTKFRRCFSSEYQNNNFPCKR